MSRPLNICVATAELSPIAKSGGLADVSAALSAALHDLGHEVLVLMPHYGIVNREPLGLEPVFTDVPAELGGLRLSYSISRGRVPNTGLPIHLLECPALFGGPFMYNDDGAEHLRFILLSRAALELCQLLDFTPDIVHCHDWHTGLVPLYLKTRYGWDQRFWNTKSVLTIHNIGYQGVFGRDILPALGIDWSHGLLHQDELREGRVNFLKTGILHADMLTTVSPTHADEIRTPEYGMYLDGLLRDRGPGLVGILNGVDYNDWDPVTDPLIPASYSRNELSGKRECKRRLLDGLGMEIELGRPLFGIVSRLVPQKGMDLVLEAMPGLLEDHDMALAILGSGEEHYEYWFGELQNRFPGRVCFYRGYHNQLSHWIEAGSDFFLMPSAYEPCGLNQMYSLRYGTIPIVRKTGGLADAVEPIDPTRATGTGILFEHYDKEALTWAIEEALALYRHPILMHKIIDNGMAKDFSWDRQVQRYLEIYRMLVGEEQAPGPAPLPAWASTAAMP